jgi:hypothetical protein
VKYAFSAKLVGEKQDGEKNIANYFLEKGDKAKQSSKKTRK